MKPKSYKTVREKVESFRMFQRVLKIHRRKQLEIVGQKLTTMC